MIKINTLKPEQISFVFCSLRERIAFAELLNHQNYRLHYESDPEGYESWDVIYSDDFSRNITEIKVRKYFLKQFETDGFIFEKHKYDQLREFNESEISKETRLLSQIPNKLKYINFLYDCVLIWDVSCLASKNPIIKDLIETTINSNGNTKPKDTYLLDPKDAIKIDFKLDYDCLHNNAILLFKMLFPNNIKDIENIKLDYEN